MVFFLFCFFWLQPGLQAGLYMLPASTLAFACCVLFVSRRRRGDVAKQTEQLKSVTGTRRSPYIFNLLGFTHCLNDSCNFNESLSATDTAAIIPALQIVLAALAACLVLVASFISPNSLCLCHVESQDLSNAEAV